MKELSKEQKKVQRKLMLITFLISMMGFNIPDSSNGWMIWGVLMAGLAVVFAFNVRDMFQLSD